MSIAKSKGIKNVFFGLLNQGITIAFGLILPRLFITNYGSEANGLIASVNQIYVYIALLEAGIGTASLQALYKTVGQEDQAATNAVMAATSAFYRRTGLYYLMAVIALAAVYPIVVKSSIPPFTVAAIIIINGLGGVLNYFFQGKYRILLRAEGKNYILSNLSSIIYICSNFLKVVLVYYNFDIIWVQAGYLFFNIVQMLYISWYIKKSYPWLDLKVTPNNIALAGRKSVMVHQIASLVFSNTDLLILTVFNGLKVVSVYSMYNAFYNMIKSVLYSFLEGIQFSLGQTYNSDFEKFVKMQDAFESGYMTLTFVLYTILHIMILPFLLVYTDGITDIDYIDKFLPVLFTLIFLLQGARGPMQLVSDYARKFRETQGQAIIETIINLTVSIVAASQLGIYGVLLGTIAALLYRTNAIIIYVNKYILIRSCFVTYFRWLWRICVFGLLCYFSELVNVNPNSYVEVFVYAVPVSIVVCISYFLGMLCFERNIMIMLLNQFYGLVRSR